MFFLEERYGFWGRLTNLSSFYAVMRVFVGAATEKSGCAVFDCANATTPLIARTSVSTVDLQKEDILDVPLFMRFNGLS